VEKSGTLFRSGNLWTYGCEWDLVTCRWIDEPWEVYHLEERGEIRRGI